MKTFVCNAFSVNMLSPLPPTGRTIKVRPITLEEAQSLLREGEYYSAVGHAGTAEIISALLGVQIVPNRVSISMGPGDRALIFQLGIRLQEGQVLSKEEVESLYQQGLASFVIVEVVE